jgi:hypothetical protein
MTTGQKRAMKIEIRKISPQPGDLLVVRIVGGSADVAKLGAEIQNIKENMHKTGLNKEVTVVIMNDAMDFTLVTEEQLASVGLQRIEGWVRSA